MRETGDRTNRSNGRIQLSLVLVLCALIGLAQAGREVPDYDSRLTNATGKTERLVLRTPTPTQLAAARDLVGFREDLRIRWNPVSGSPQFVGSTNGAPLSDPRGGEPADVAQVHLRAQAELLGITTAEVGGLTVASIVRRPHGAWRVHFEQRIGGIEVFGSHANVNVSPDGAVTSFGTIVFSGLRSPGEPVLGAVDAVREAMGDVYPDLSFVPEPLEKSDTPEQRVRFVRGDLGAPPSARLILFPEADGARLAWEVMVAEPTRETSYRVLIDASDGAVLYRRNRVLHADARVLGTNVPEPIAEEAEPLSHDLLPVPDAAEPTAWSPLGWIDGDGTILQGNNVLGKPAYFTLPPLESPSASFDDPFNTGRSALVNAWWWANDAHDRFYALGFDEIAGNLQNDNFGHGGAGGDALNLVHYVLGMRNNAWYVPTNDGEPPEVGLFWLDCERCVDHDGYPENGSERSGAFDRSVIYHEYTHAVTTRMVGGPATECLFAMQSGAMGEGWSDFFGSDFTDDHRIGEYFVSNRGFLRSSLHDLTYAETCEVTDGGCEVHAEGMIWAGILWDLRSSMQALHGAGGIDTTARIIVEALTLSPCDPSMVDMRDAVLQADTELNGAAHHTVIWNAFADRGLGEGASSVGGDDPDPIADFTTPPAHVCTAPAAPTGLTATPEGANAVRLSYSAPGSAAMEIWRLDRGIPYARPARIGFTTDTATYLDTDLQGGREYRYHVVALGPGGVGCGSADSSTADATASGTCSGYPVFTSAVSVTDSPSGCGSVVAWEAALPACPDDLQPITYSVYRAPVVGFEPSPRTLIARTTDTTITDSIPADGRTRYYLVLAEHGTPDDRPDHGDRGSRQLMRWIPGYPAEGREEVVSWDFDSGDQGWTADNTNDPTGGWVRVDPWPTWYGGTLLAPDEAAGGTGMAWVTGDAGGTASVTAFDCDGETYLQSPVWDGLGGATLLTFDYWSGSRTWDRIGRAGIDVLVDNGANTAIVRGIGSVTTQRFDSPARHGWQTATIDLSAFIEPTATLSVRFTSMTNYFLSEYGIDNVRVERATSCSRPHLRIDSLTVDDGDAGWGNGNGTLEPGETARLDVVLANDGGITAFSPKGRLSTVSPVLAVHDDTVEFQDAPAGGTAAPTGGSLTASMLHEAGCENAFALDFEWIDASGTRWREVVNLEPGYTVTEQVFADDFETDTGWTIDGDVVTPGFGRWERGVPVGTKNGLEDANPPHDSPYDAGDQCYVTENGISGGPPNNTDTDFDQHLTSPPMDLTPYKRARLFFDWWYYDDSHVLDLQQDSLTSYALVDDGTGAFGPFRIAFQPTSGWEQVETLVNAPLTAEFKLRYTSQDRGPLDYPGATDSLVESGVDNVRVEGELQVCDLDGATFPPNGVGDTFRVDREEDLLLSWQPSPVDGGHEPAAYYEVHASAGPDGGFAVVDSTTGTSLSRPPGSSTKYFLISAANAAGDSSDRPLP